jgi:hypothetical protein
MFAQDMYPQATLPAGATPGRALTTNLPVDVHGAIDRPWIPQWQSAKAAGAEVKAGAAHDMIAGGMESALQNPAMHPPGVPPLITPAASGTMQWRLFDEMFRGLGLTRDSIILPPNP